MGRGARCAHKVDAPAPAPWKNARAAHADDEADVAGWAWAPVRLTGSRGARDRREGGGRGPRQQQLCGHLLHRNCTVQWLVRHVLAAVVEARVESRVFCPIEGRRKAAPRLASLSATTERRSSQASFSSSLSGARRRAPAVTVAVAVFFGRARRRGRARSSRPPRASVSSPPPRWTKNGHPREAQGARARVQPVRPQPARSSLARGAVSRAPVRRRRLADRARPRRPAVPPSSAAAAAVHPPTPPSAPAARRRTRRPSTTWGS